MAGQFETPYTGKVGDVHGRSSLQYLKIMLLTLFTLALQAKEPPVPTVRYLENSYFPCFTDNGKSIAFLNGNQLSPTVNLLNTEDWSYTVKESPVMTIGDKLLCGQDSLITLEKKYIRQLDTMFLKQMYVKSKDVKTEWLDRIVVADTLFVSDSEKVKITSLKDFKQEHVIHWPKGVEPSAGSAYSESKILLRGRGKNSGEFYLIDVKSGKIKDVSAEISGKNQKLTGDGTLLSINAKMPGLSRSYQFFKTDTLEHLDELERYISKLKNEEEKEKDRVVQIKFFEKHKDLLLIGIGWKLIAWDMQDQKPKRIIELPYDAASFDYHNGSVLISGGHYVPYFIIDADTGKMRQQPLAYNKPLGVFIQNSTPKMILKTGPISIGIWNMFERRWEQRFDNDYFFFNISQVSVSGDNLFIARKSSRWNKSFPIRQYSLESGRLLYAYETDSGNNQPTAIASDDKHKRLVVFYEGSRLGGMFKVFDTQSGFMLHMFAPPRKHPSVESMNFSDDGKQLIVKTRKNYGFVKVEFGPHYRYDNNASVFTWDLSTEKVTVEPCNNRCKPQYGIENLVAEGDEFSVAWEESRRAIAVTKDDDPYRQIYVYTPYGTSEWIEMDNFGNFDASEHGEQFVFMCENGRCVHLNENDKRYFKKPGLLEQYLNEKGQ